MTDQAIQTVAPEKTVLAQYSTPEGKDITLTQEIINYYFCPDANAADAALFAALCEQLHANPYVGDIYIIKYGNSPASVLPSKDFYLKRADRLPEYDGMEHGVIYLTANGEVQEREGQAIYKAIGEKLLGAWCNVYRKDRAHPTKAKVALDEYDQHRNLWNKMPAVMIDKVAQSTALRQAFPQEFAGTYDSAEIAPNMQVPEPPRQSQPAQQKPPITDEVRQELERMSQVVGDKRAVWDAYQSGGLEAVHALIQPEQPEEDPDIEF